MSLSKYFAIEKIIIEREVKVGKDEENSVEFTTKVGSNIFNFECSFSLEDEELHVYLNQMDEDLETCVEINYTMTINGVNVDQFKEDNICTVVNASELFALNSQQSLKLMIVLELLVVQDKYFDKLLENNCWRETFSDFQDDQDLCDFTLTFPDGEKIPVHRFLLAKRSKVFKAMFSNAMSEKSDSKVLISDINSRTMQEVIDFIYKGRLRSHDPLMLLKVLYAGEKYEINELNEVCVARLKDYMNDGKDMSKCIDIYIAADLYNIKLLKCMSFQIILNRFEELKDAIEQRMPLPLIMEIMSLMKNFVKINCKAV